MDELQTSTLYVELDTLFDTRLATLYSFGETRFKMAFTERYYTRISDDFPGITREEFNAVYAKRSKETIRNAVTLAQTFASHKSHMRRTDAMTPVIQLIIEFVLATTHQIQSSPFHYKPKIVLNTYPYEFTDEEAMGFIMALRALTGEKADIEVITRSMEEVTPRYLKQDVALAVMYDYISWLEYHAAHGFQQLTCPEVTLTAPKLIVNAAEWPQLVSAAKDANLVTIFQGIEMQASPMIGLRLHPVETFCLTTRVKKG